MEALHLNVQRIDHGVRCLESPEVLAKLKENQIPLTLCPLSNVALKVYDHMVYVFLFIVS